MTDPEVQHEINKSLPLQVQVRNGMLSASIGINTLAFASSWENGGPVENLSIPLESAKWWAKKVAMAIEMEAHSESSYINRFLDEAIERANEFG